MRYLLIVLLFTASPLHAQTVDREFKLWSGALVISSVFDAETTIAGIKSGRAHEANPIAAPFVGSGDRGGTYAYVAATDALVIYGAYRLKRAGRPWRWVLIGGTALHVVAGSSNLRFVIQ